MVMPSKEDGRMEAIGLLSRKQLTNLESSETTEEETAPYLSWAKDMTKKALLAPDFSLMENCYTLWKFKIRQMASCVLVARS